MTYTEEQISEWITWWCIKNNQYPRIDAMNEDGIKEYFGNKQKGKQ